MRTEHLTESQPAELEITGEQARALQLMGEALASDKAWWGDDDIEELADSPRPSVARVMPTVSGRWKVTIVDAIGVVSLPDLQLVVSPKIRRDHLLYLFAQSHLWPRLFEQAAELEEAKDLAELVAEWYLNCLERVLRLDLIRDYHGIEDNLESVRGQIIPLPTAALYYSGRLAAHCEFEEFDVDTPPNRVLKAAAQVIVAGDAFALDRRRRALRYAARMTEVGPLQVGDLRAAAIERRTAHYRDALLLARHVIRASGRTLSAGLEPAQSFLIRTPEMVELGLRQLLHLALGPSVTVIKKGIKLEGSTLRLTPDLLFLPSGAVGDVKYQLSEGSWSRSHIYQGVTFATGFRTADGLVVTFSQRTGIQHPDVKVGDVTLHPVCWESVDGLSADDAAMRLVASVSAWLKSISVPALAVG